ncbi:MAG: UDP-N-acetylmuramoyl-L-alanine--D-glutamate ligase [Patescibacteria group bacterium]
MSIENISFKDKKVLVFGLGLLGGGLATTNWLIKHGAKITITDLKTEADLARTLKKIKGKVSLKLAGHSKEDIESSDLIVMNPDVSINNEYIQYAFKHGIPVENEATIFLKQSACPVVGVTGTRGKTTTTHWINHFIGRQFRSAIAGNSTEYQFLKIVDRTAKLDWVASEIPSFHLELFNEEMRKPDIAVITNLYQDHLNRHGTMNGYADAKANLFTGQRQGQFLVLNADNKWMPYLLKIAKNKSKSHVWFFSATGKLSKKQNGVFYRKGEIWYQFDGHAHPVIAIKDFEHTHGSHNLENLLAAALSAYLAGITGKEIQSRIATLPQIPFRQEIIYTNKRLTIINDTTATSPDGAIAAVKRFSGPHTILIAGGTDRDLDFTEWGKVIPQHIKLENIILLSGSATDKMQAALKGGPFGKSKVASPCQTLVDCLAAALAQAQTYGHWVVLFSPGSKSFEKFKNEFDRGEQFNALVKKVMRR